MITMRKTLILTLALVFTLSACGGEPAETKEPSSEMSASPTPSLEASSSPVPTSNEIVFEEQTIVDNDACTIRITGVDPGNMWGYTLKAALENKSTDKTYMFSITSAAVNGVQSDPLFATEVAPGKKANSEISFMDSSLRDNGIIDFTDIELSFRVYDSNDWTAASVAEETVHIYPYGEAQAIPFVRQTESSDLVILDNEFLTVTVTGYDAENMWGYAVNLFLENKSDKEIMFSISEASINGYMADPFYATSVRPGKCAFSSITWFDSTLEENDITEVEEIEFSLRAYDANDWTADDFANQVITLNP